MPFSLEPELVAWFTQPWVAETVTTTSLSSINPSLIPSLSSDLASITERVVHATATDEVKSLRRAFRGVQASLTIAQGQQYLATATSDDSYRSFATEAMNNATLSLKYLHDKDNFYGTRLTLGGNILFTVLFGLLFLYQSGMMAWSRHFYFGICMFCGVGLEFAGYLARALAAKDLNNMDMFLCQIICLTIAPAFIMAGIYYVLAQLLVVYGRKYSLLKPMWFSYIFIFCDVASLVIQAAGGGMAGMALAENKESVTGTHVMVAGIAWQVFSMSLFLILLFHWMFHIFFRSSDQVPFTFGNLVHLLFNTKRGQELKQIQEPHFNPLYADARRRRVFGWFPLILMSSVLFVYTRCIYRVVELAEGWDGFLITHEAYVLTLDAAMMFCGCALYAPFHPALMFGRKTDLSLATIKHNRDEGVPVTEKGFASEDAMEGDTNLNSSDASS
ncbi:hypothetical protein DICA1_E01772 [Diutina catenulata]